MIYLLYLVIFYILFYHIQHYQKALGTCGMFLNSTIELLRNTSVLVKNFCDATNYKGKDDARLKENRNVLNFFEKWEKEVQGLPIAKTEQASLLMPW